MKYDRVQIGSNVRTARETAGVTQEFLSEQVGLSRSSIANIESGRQRMPVHVLCDIATILGVSASYLLGEPDAPDRISGLALENIFAQQSNLTESLSEIRGLLTVAVKETEAMTAAVAKLERV